MADAMLTEFLLVLFGKLTSPLVQEVRSLLTLDEALDELKKTLISIKALLQDADEKQFRSAAVAQWLGDLKDVTYDINDTVDDVLIEARRRRLNNLNPVREFLAHVGINRALFRRNLAARILEINERVDRIDRRRVQLQLRGTDEAELIPEATSTSSAIDKSKVFGRETDVKTIIQLLASDGVSAAGICVIPIVGMAGVGKTTLAQLVFNHDAVSNLFEMKLWVHVPADFSVAKLIKTIIQSILRAEYCSRLELELVQQHLQRLLDGKKYLLVLDDVGMESPQEWEKLQIALRVGATGSKTLITTQSLRVARALGTTAPHQLSLLSDDHCWSLFKKHAFDDNHLTADQSWVRIGKDIVNNCKGLPLAVVHAGLAIRSDTLPSKWESLRDNSIWEGNNIPRTLSQRYHQLSGPLKRCFAYCSMFPEGFVFDKETLVQLWIAQDFIQSDDDKLEEKGSQYFDDLFSRSFFQFKDFVYSTDRPRYIMHAYYRGLAKSVAGQECLAIDHDLRCQISKKTRHVSVVPDVLQSRASSLKALYQAERLYTLLLVHQSSACPLWVPVDLADKLRCLRSLDLSDTGLYQLPDSVGKLEHLRFLGLCNTGIEELPESVCFLYNLQSLRLRNCYRLKRLPKCTKYLIHLRHLDLLLHDQDELNAHGDELISMPPEIGTLSSLRTLTRFVVGEGGRCGIDEMKNLNRLHGELQVSKLHNVLRASQAMEASLINKRSIRVLELRWGDGNNGGARDWRLEAQVLANLQPSTALKELVVSGYEGGSFPTWLEHRSYSSLVTVKLLNCKQSQRLPTLGRLPSLKELYIEGMDRVDRVDCSFCGETRGCFPSLRKLQFEKMFNWEKWRGHEECELPSLVELAVKDCPKLLQLTHLLPALAKLEIQNCPQLLGLPVFPSLRSLTVTCSGEWVWKSWRCLSSLHSLSLVDLPTRTIPQGLRGHEQIRRMEIRECRKLEALPDEWIPASLTDLVIKHCPQLREIPEKIGMLSSLKHLKIHDCERLALRNPQGLQHLKLLPQFEVSECPLLFCSFDL